jgi:YVTN family beta-propeller protein
MNYRPALPFLFCLLAMSTLSSAQSVVATVPVSPFPTQVAVNSKTNVIYTVSTNNFVSVINGNTNKAIAAVGVGNAPGHLVVNPNSNRVYVSNYMDNTVSVIDGKTNRVIANIVLWNAKFIRTGQIAVNPITNRVYTISQDSSVLHPVFVIDGKSNKVAAKLDACTPESIAVDKTRNLFYVATSSLCPDNVWVFDGSTNQVISSFTVGGVGHRIEDMWVDEINDRLVMVDTYYGKLLFVDASTGVTVGSVAGFQFIADVDGFSNQALAVVQDERANTVSYIDTNTFQITHTVAVGNTPYGVAVNQTTGRVYTANIGDATSTVLSAPQ